jgi:hypothetical protein
MDRKKIKVNFTAMLCSYAVSNRYSFSFHGLYPNVSAGQPFLNYSLEYHVFVVEWNATTISWFVDDVFYMQRYAGDSHNAIIPQVCTMDMV